MGGGNTVKGLVIDEDCFQMTCIYLLTCLPQKVPFRLTFISLQVMDG